MGDRRLYARVTICSTIQHNQSSTPTAMACQVEDPKIRKRGRKEAQGGDTRDRSLPTVGELVLPPSTYPHALAIDAQARAPYLYDSILCQTTLRMIPCYFSGAIACTFIYVPGFEGTPQKRRELGSLLTASLVWSSSSRSPPGA